jgi:hypothetical protein
MGLKRRSQPPDSRSQRVHGTDSPAASKQPDPPTPDGADSQFASDHKDEEMTYDKERLIQRFRNGRMPDTASGSGTTDTAPVPKSSMPETSMH